MRGSWADVLLRVALILASTVGVVPVVAADDWYVDAVYGSDANAGDSPLTAWRTITFAMATAPAAPAGGAQVIHVAPGIYDASLGEVFPITMRSDFQVVGEVGAQTSALGGAPSTVLDGGGAGTLVQAFWISPGIGEATGPRTLLEGLVLRNAERGVFVGTNRPGMHLTLRHVRIFGMRSIGLAASAFGGPNSAGQILSMLEAVEVFSCGAGVGLRVNGNGYTPSLPSSLELVDCSVHDNDATGVEAEVEEAFNEEAVRVACTRTRITSNGGSGVYLSMRSALAATLMDVVLSDSLVARNGGHGIAAQAYSGAFLPARLGLDVEGCTVADNAGSGLDLVDTTPSFAGTVLSADLAGAILDGNGDDLRDDAARPMVSSIAFCDVGDGGYAAVDGNISADPLFVDRAAGDYRLRFGSPCVETGDPSAVGTRDLAGLVRPLDGDLDGSAAPDMGAHELAPLFVAGVPHLGATLALEVWGPSGAKTVLYGACGPLAAPLPTPYGDFLLPPDATVVYARTLAAPGPPTSVPFTVPAGPSWIGRAFSFQALIVTPAGNVLSNAVELDVVP